jgi:hypothetical protein
MHPTVGTAPLLRRRREGHFRRREGVTWSFPEHHGGTTTPRGIVGLSTELSYLMDGNKGIVSARRVGAYANICSENQEAVTVHLFRVAAPLQEGMEHLKGGDLAKNIPGLKLCEDPSGEWENKKSGCPIPSCCYCRTVVNSFLQDLLQRCARSPIPPLTPPLCTMPYSSPTPPPEAEAPGRQNAGSTLSTVPRSSESCARCV